MSESLKSDNATRKPLQLFVDAFWISPWAFTCFVALEEKKLAYEVVPVALHEKAQHDPAYRDRTVTGRVPALRDGDFWLAESQAIVDYLEEGYPDTPRVLPSGLEQRARARQILGWIRSDGGALREERSTHTMFYERAKSPLGAEARAAADKLVRVASALVPDGATSIFGAWTIADSDLAFALHRLILNGDEIPARLRAFTSALWTRPSTRAFVDRPRIPYVAY